MNKVKKMLLIAPVIISGAILTNHLNQQDKTAHADEIAVNKVSVDQSLAISNTIETKTVYYSGNKSDTVDTANQDSLVSNDKYSSDEDGGVSATVLSETSNKTHQLLSEKAISEINAEEKLGEAERLQNEEVKRVAEEKAKAEQAEKERQAAEEKRVADEKAAAEVSQTSSSGPIYTPTAYGQSGGGGVGIDGARDIQPNYAGTESYPVGQCTWGAKALAPWAGPYWGNGGQWGYSAAAEGYRVDKTPEVGAIVSWDDGGYGHVAVVVAVSGNMIQVKESNYLGQQYINNFRGWFDPNAGLGSVLYIHPR